MLTSRKVGFLTTLCLLTGGAIVLFTTDRSASHDGRTFVYLCAETGELVAGPPWDTPAVNEETGRPTLFRARYCDRCCRWYPTRPSSMQTGNPLAARCPKHETILVADGPLPPINEDE